MENKEDDRLGPQASLAAWGVPRNARAVTTAKRSSELLGRPLAQVPDPHPCSRNFHRAANHGRGSSAVTGNDESRELHLRPFIVLTSRRSRFLTSSPTLCGPEHDHFGTPTNASRIS